MADDELSETDRPPPGWRRVREAGWLIPRLWRGIGHLDARGPADGPPAFVIPGFFAGDRSAMELRRALAEAGWRTHPWGLGLNRGVRPDTLRHLRQRLDVLYDGRPILLVGWSLGGLYARELARAEPERVRAVVTLGSPIVGDPRRYTNVWRLYELVAGHPVDDPPVPNIEAKPPVPALAIWSPVDGIVAPPSARGTAAARDEAAEVRSSHMGFAISRTATRAAVAAIVAWLRSVEASN